MLRPYKSSQVATTVFLKIRAPHDVEPERAAFILCDHLIAMIAGNPDLAEDWDAAGIEVEEFGLRVDPAGQLSFDFIHDEDLIDEDPDEE